MGSYVDPSYESYLGLNYMHLSRADSLVCTVAVVAAVAASAAYASFPD